MNDFNSDLIRDLAVHATEEFLNNKIPLNETLAKEASANEFNPDQIQRLVEASNSITYLKMLGVAKDKTFEFPLASQKEVLAKIMFPNGLPSEEDTVWKAESFKPFEPVEKTASFSDFSGDFEHGLSLAQAELTDAASRAILLKEASKNKAILESNEAYSSTLAARLVKVAKLVNVDPSGMDKLAHVASEADFRELSLLASGSIQPYREFTKSLNFEDASLKNVKTLVGLHKEAKELLNDISKRKMLDEKAAPLLKQAAMAASGPTAPKVPAMAKPLQMGNAVGTAGAKVVGAPIKAGAKLVGKTIMNPVKTLDRVGGPIADALFYNPGIEASTGRSNDVWDAIHG